MGFQLKVKRGALTETGLFESSLHADRRLREHAPKRSIGAAAMTASEVKTVGSPGIQFEQIYGPAIFRFGSGTDFPTQPLSSRIFVRSTLDFCRHAEDRGQSRFVPECMARPCVARRSVERANVRGASMYQTSGMEH